MLRTLLIYKNEIAMSFGKFLTNMQTMFTGFSENQYILNDLQNINILFQKVQNAILTQIKASIQVSYDLDQSKIVTCYFITNSLAAEAKILGDHAPQVVVDVNTCGDKSQESGVKGSGGTIFTGFYPYWSNILSGEKQSVFDKRDQLNIKGGGKRKSVDKKKQSRAASIKFKNKAAQEIQCKISSLKAKCKELEEKRIASKESDEPQYNADNQFGSRKGKKQKKRSE